MIGPYLQQLQTASFAALAAEERRLWAAAVGDAAAVAAMGEAQAPGLSEFLSDLADPRSADGDMPARWPRPMRDALPMSQLLSLRHQAVLAFLDGHATAVAEAVAITQALAARFGTFHALACRHDERERLATLAHDLRSPLTALSGALNVLKRTMSTHIPGETPRMVEVALANATRLVHEVDRILDLGEGEGEAESPTPDRGRPRVVIVESDAAIRLVMQSVLEHHGCEVLAVPLLETVPEAAGGRSTVFFVEDRQLSSACAVMAAHPQTAGAPVVAIGHVLEQEDEVVAGRIVARLAKPFKAASLVEALNTAVEATTPHPGCVS